MDDKLLNRKEAADLLGVSPDTLAYWKCMKKQDIPTVKIGSLVKYRISDLRRFIEERIKTYGEDKNGLN